MKKILLAAVFSALVIALNAQRFELRIIDKGQEAHVQIRNVGERALRTTDNRVTDIVFGVKWLDTGIDFLEVVPGPYKMVASGGVKDHNGYHFQAFGGMQTPYLMPVDWKKDAWVDVCVLKVHEFGQHAPKPGQRFALTETGFDVTTDPNVGIDLVDETPKIVPYQVSDIGIAPYTPLEKVELDVTKYGPRHSHLTWTVDAPDDVRGYVVERRIGEGQWEELAILQSEGQYVNVFVDENAYDGVSLKERIEYQVRVVTNEGEKMSDVKGVDFNSQKMITEVFPNPASDKVSIEMTPTETAGDAYLEMYDTEGKLVYRNQILPSSVKEEIDLNAFNANGGSYTVHLVSGGKILDAHPLHVMR